MERIDLVQLVDRLRRAQPRNADVMALCDYAMVTLQTKPVTYQPEPVTYQATTCPRCEALAKRERDRVRRWREAKSNGS
jgi:hypothetical protein